MHIRFRSTGSVGKKRWMVAGALLVATTTSTWANNTADVTVSNFRLSVSGQAPGTVGYLFPWRSQRIEGISELYGVLGDSERRRGWFAPLDTSVTSALGSASTSQGHGQWTAHADLIGNAPYLSDATAEFYGTTGRLTWAALSLAPHATLTVSLDYTLASQVAETCVPGPWSTCEYAQAEIQLSGENVQDLDYLRVGGGAPLSTQRSGSLQISLVNPTDQWSVASLYLEGVANVNSVFNVPEPSTPALFGGGLLILIFGRGNVLAARRKCREHLTDAS